MELALKNSKRRKYAQPLAHTKIGHEVIIHIPFSIRLRPKDMQIQLSHYKLNCRIKNWFMKL